jgi:hypothetical protein
MIHLHYHHHHNRHNRHHNSTYHLFLPSRSCSPFPILLNRFRADACAEREWRCRNVQLSDRDQFSVHRGARHRPEGRAFVPRPVLQNSRLSGSVRKYRTRIYLAAVSDELSLAQALGRDRDVLDPNQPQGMMQSSKHKPPSMVTRFECWYGRNTFRALATCDHDHDPRSQRSRIFTQIPSLCITSLG